MLSIQLPSFYLAEPPTTSSQAINVNPRRAASLHGPSFLSLPSCLSPTPFASPLITHQLNTTQRSKHPRRIHPRFRSAIKQPTFLSTRLASKTQPSRSRYLPHPIPRFLATFLARSCSPSLCFALHSSPTTIP